MDWIIFYYLICFIGTFKKCKEILFLTDELEDYDSSDYCMGLYFLNSCYEFRITTPPSFFKWIQYFCHLIVSPFVNISYMLRIFMIKER